MTTIDSSICPHDIATLLKEFFRDLPEPLLTKHLYRAFLQTQSESLHLTVLKLESNFEFVFNLQQ